MRNWLLLLIALVAGCAPPTPPVATNLAVPLQTLDGTPASLEQFVRGRVTVVSFWATWCDACKIEMPAIIRLEAKAEHRGDFDVVTVAVGEDASAIRAFAATNRVPRAILLDPEFALASSTRNRVPTTLVLDRDGRIVHEGGGLDAAALAALRKEVGP